MLRKTCVRLLMDSPHVKSSETQHKFAQQNFWYIFWSFLKEISSKNSFLLVSAILRLFVNIVTPDEKYSLSVKASV